MKTLDKIAARVAMPILSIAAVLLILVIALSTQSTNRDNNGYIRVINCVISIPASVRTQNDIEDCYKTVEKDLGIKLVRYDTSNYRK